jgi:signal transduction histidine kinase
VAAERERISREIHDTLAQGFTSVVTLTRATQSALDRGNLELVRERLRVIEQTASENLAEARLIVAEMTPGHLQSRTLVEALQRLVDAVSDGSGMTGRLVVEGEPVVLPANSEVVLLRSAQEGLANVRRHSRAGSFEVRLRYAGDAPVSLEVTDDGVGFDGAAERQGYGLDGATARAAEVGGRFEVDSAPGHGARVRVEVPR